MSTDDPWQALDLGMALTLAHPKDIATRREQLYSARQQRHDSAIRDEYRRTHPPIGVAG